MSVLMMGLQMGEGLPFRGWRGWQDKSRDVRRGVGRKIFRDYKGQARCVNVRRSLRSCCMPGLATAKRTSQVGR
jgi:hypothetical protein